jgi:hypothetical protein
MFEEPTDMTSDPGHPDLEALLAADEAAIADDDFSRRLAAKLEHSSIARRVTIYGAGLMGLGFAVGSLLALVRALPPLRITVDRAVVKPDLVHLPDLTRLASWSPDSQATFLVVGAAAAMILATLLLAARER